MRVWTKSNPFVLQMSRQQFDKNRPLNINLARKYALTDDCISQNVKFLSCHRSQKKLYRTKVSKEFGLR